MVGKTNCTTKRSSTEFKTLCSFTEKFLFGQSVYNFVTPWWIFNTEVNSRVTCDGYTMRKLTVSSFRQEEHIGKTLAQASNDPEFAPFSVLRIGRL
jgi:hypothetical protein